MAKKATASTEEVFEETMVVEQPKKKHQKRLLNHSGKLKTERII